MKPDKLWTLYRVRWDFITKLCASVPANPELVEKWLDARKPAAMPPGSRSIAEVQEEVFATIATEEEEVSNSLLVFQRIDGGLVLRAATVRAHIKDCARILSTRFVGRLKGEAAFSTKVINCVYHDEQQYWLPILHSDGSQFTRADDTYDKPVHTRFGSCLKTIEFVREASLEFTLKVLGNQVSRDDLETLFTYGGVHGYGGERGDGEGRYTFQITEEK